MKEAERVADEEIRKYQILLNEEMTNYRVFGNFTNKAKQCALLHVVGIIEENKSILEMIKLHLGTQKGRICLPIKCRIEEMQEVKTIIENK